MSENGDSAYVNPNRPDKPWLWDSDRAREMGRAGGSVKRVDENRVPSLAEIRSEGDALLWELVKAAKGLGTWSELSADKRLMALVRANEHINGRPNTRKPDSEPEDEEAGFSVGVREA